MQIIIITIIYLLGVITYSILEWKFDEELTAFNLLSWLGAIILSIANLTFYIEDKLNEAKDKKYLKSLK